MRSPALRRGVEKLAISLYNPDEEIHKERKKHYWEDEGGIVDFVQEILHATPKSYQVRILNSVQKHRRVAAKSLRGVGKTTTASWVVLWCLACAPGEVKVITTASVWEQLQRYLWPEIRKWALKADWDAIGVVMRDKKELLLQEINLDAGQRTAFATSPGQTERIEGAHAQTVCYIFDESKIIPDEVFDAIEGAFSTKGTNAFAFAVSTPGAPLGRFYKIHQRDEAFLDWHIENVSYQEAIEAGAIEEAWAEGRKKQWGENDPRYKNQVLGDFADSSDYGLIKRSWVQASQMKWISLQGQKQTGKIVYGVDVADTGKDKTAICKFIDNYCEFIKYYDEEVMEVVPRVAKYVGPDTGGIEIGFDGNGVGAGAFQVIRKLGYKIHNLVAQSKAVDRAGMPETDSTKLNTFANKRAAMYWALREALDPNSTVFADLALPPDNDLEEDLVAPEWNDDKNVIRITEKKLIKEKLGGRSPDGGDAIAMAWYILSRSTRRRGARAFSL